MSEAPNNGNDDNSGTTMRAIVQENYGSPEEVLNLREVPRPTPSAKEVLVRVVAASVHAGDKHLIRGTPWPIRLAFGLFRPSVKIPGTDISGVVEAVGKDVIEFKVGDEIFADCSGSGFGAFAEYVSITEEHVCLKPTNFSFQQAATVPVSGGTALIAVRDVASVKAGQKVLVNGASGGVGMFIVQIAKSYGAVVTGVCATEKVDMVTEIGADYVVDYKKEDCTKTGDKYDVIFDAAAYRNIKEFIPALKDDGVYVPVGGSFSILIQAMTYGTWVSKTSRKKVKSFVAWPAKELLESIKEFVEEGKISPYLDKKFELKDVPEAVKHIEDRKVQGKVVIEM